MTLTANAPTRARSPSAWSYRLPVLLLALVGAVIATYLTLFQWHITTTVWDPLFGSASSEAVLTAPLTRRLPLPDATLGALAYIVEAILTLLGGEDRYDTRPWLVLLYGLVLAGLALTSLALVLIQIFIVHALCSLCLCSAAISFINAWLGRDEVLAATRELNWRTHAHHTT
jgi:uncharacterized membrane protein